VARAIRARVLGPVCARAVPVCASRQPRDHRPQGRRRGLRLRSAVGAAAWWLWGAIHVGFLVGVRNRVSVLFDWFWSYLTFTGATRLITGGEAAVKTYR